MGIYQCNCIVVNHFHQENRKRAEEERRRRALKEEKEREAARKAQEKLDEESRIRNEEIERLEVYHVSFKLLFSFILVSFSMIH